MWKSTRTLHGGYKKTFDKVQSLVTEYEWEWLSSVAEFVSRDSKKRGRKICIFVPIMSASETPAINSSSKANYCKWIFLQIASKQNCSYIMLQSVCVPFRHVDFSIDGTLVCPFYCHFLIFRLLT